MNVRIRLRALVLTLPLIAPILPALPGCGGSEETASNAPSDELKKSEASYEAEIAKDKAARAAGKAAK